ncbi:MAG: GNAT family protein [Planctomycetota bacterium]
MQTYDIRPDLRLRPAATADADELHLLIDRNRAHLRRWLPWLDGANTPADQEVFLTGVVEQAREGRGGVWIIEETQQISGVCGFNHIDSANRSAEIGYWLSADRQGHGIVTACVARLLQHAFEDLGLDRLTIPIAIENSRSRAIPERLGFRHEDTLPQAEWLYDHHVDHALYTLAHADWRPPDADA